MIGKKRSLSLVLMILLIFAGYNIKAEDVVTTNQNALIYKIPITGEIDQGLLKLVERGFQAAEEAQADLVILEVDTFGGYVDAAIGIKDIIFKSPLSTVTYVKGRAWSAGALITLAGETVAMVPGSSIGDAETRPKEEKYISALRKEFKATAESRGKNPDLAAAMVDADLEVEGIIASGKLLTLTAEEAVTYNIADLMVNNLPELYQAMNIKPARIVEIEMSSPEKAARIITKPTVTTLLVTIGVIALIIEALMLGWGVAGTVGLISLGVVFSSYIYYGVAGWGLLILFLIGLILLALEIFVIPGFGITGLGGIAALFTSLYFLFPTPEIAFSALATVLLLSIVATVILLKFFGGSRFWQRIALGESQTKEAGYLAQEDQKDLVGKAGLTVTPLRPAGIVDLSGKRVDVVSEGGFIDRGRVVQVVEIEGNRIVVKLKEGEDS